LLAQGDHEVTTFPELARVGRLSGFAIPEGVSWRAIDTAKDLETAAKELTALSWKHQTSAGRNTVPTGRSLCNPSPPQP
jgi:NDP-sugar pyrophosphorylase family protein